MMISFFFFLIICCIHDSNGQSRLCGSEDKPAVQICSNDNLTADRKFYITTTSVPKFQQILCKCLITSVSSEVGISFSFVGDFPHSVSFQVNDGAINSGEQNTFTPEDGSLTLSFLTNEHYTQEGACLMVSSGMKITTDTTFNVTCDRTNSSERTDNNMRNTTGKDDDNIIIPVVAASISVFVCLTVVIFIVIICRRRPTKRNKQPKIANQGFTKKTNDDGDDDYYMTENPMYQTADTETNIHDLNNEYHYAESAKHNKHVNTGDLKRYSDSKEFINKGNHHDYSTCASSGQKRNPAAKAKTVVDTQKNDNSAVNENTYDTTNAASVQPFQGFNEYHHLGNAGQMKLAVVDVYNKIGNASKFPGQEDEEDVSHYHVTNSR